MEKNRIYITDPSLPLMKRVDKTLAYYRYSVKTCQAYRRWIKSYIIFLGKKKTPEDRYQKEIGPFLDSLKIENDLSPASQRQALNAISFLYKRVFGVDIDIGAEPVKIRQQSKTPLVISKSEVRSILSFLKGRNHLMASLMYGSGLRLTELIRLRVHHLDFKRNIIHVYSVKKKKARQVMIPKKAKPGLVSQVEKVRDLYRSDLEQGHGATQLPQDLKAQYQNGQKDFVWQYVFPAKKRIFDSSNGQYVRSHVMESGLQKAVKTAVKKANIKSAVSCNTLRHSFALHLLEKGIDIYRLKELMGHSDIKSVQVYVQIMKEHARPIQSPLDLL